MNTLDILSSLWEERDRWGERERVRGRGRERKKGSKKISILEIN
jgi:hypothetical protein